MLQRYSIDAFLRDNPGDRVQVHALQPAEAQSALAALASTVGAATARPAAIFKQAQKVSAYIRWDEFNLTDPCNSLHDAFSRLGLSVQGEVLVNWLRPDAVDKLSYEDLCKLFDYCWAGGTDVMIFDPACQWLVLVPHSGGVQLFRPGIFPGEIASVQD